MTTPGKTKRREPESNTPPISTRKKSKDHHQHACPICEREIIEAQDESKGEDVSEGDNAVFCEGLCQKWFHRTYCGLARELFAAMGESNEPFMCYYCMTSKQRDEINDLKALVKTLSDKITSLSDQSISQSSSTASNQQDSRHGEPLESAVFQVEYLTKEIASIKTTLTSLSTTSVSNDPPVQPTTVAPKKPLASNKTSKITQKTSILIENLMLLFME